MQSTRHSSKLHLASKVALLGLAACVAIVAALAVLPSMIGFHPVVVLSGSMEPTLRVGDIAVTRPVDPLTLGVGDVVTYHSRTGLTTHRIVDVEQTGSGRAFQMKGDANDTVDRELVPDDKVVAKLAYRIPLIGYLMVFADSTEGMASLIGGPLVILALMWARDWDKKRAGSRPKPPRPIRGRQACQCIRCWSAVRGISFLGA